jgi:hypothetical protein
MNEVIFLDPQGLVLNILDEGRVRTQIQGMRLISPKPEE